MKKLIIMSAAMAAMFMAASAKVTPEERRERIYNKTGGFVQRPVEGKFLKIVNAAGISDTALAEVRREVDIAVRFPTVITVGGSDVNAAKDDKTGFVLVVAKEGGPRILAAPEDGWAKVDVAGLDADGKEKFELRARKEIWRGLVYGLGGGNSKFPQCIMKPMRTVAELDANGAQMACPEAYEPITASAKMFGIKPNYPATYLQACCEGWAPAPTNDVQKAIWEKVKAEKSVKPSNPLKVNFDPKTAPKVGE